MMTPNAPAQGHGPQPQPCAFSPTRHGGRVPCSGWLGAPARRDFPLLDLALRFFPLRLGLQSLPCAPRDGGGAQGRLLLWLRGLGVGVINFFFTDFPLVPRRLLSA